MSARSHADGFSMFIFVHVAHRVKTFLELFAVCGETNNGKDDAVVRANMEDFRITARIYRVATGRAGVAGEYSEVAAADAQD